MKERATINVEITTWRKLHKLRRRKRKGAGFESYDDVIQRLLKPK